MKPVFKVSGSAWALLAVSALVAGAGFALPRFKPLQIRTADELNALRSEREGLAPNSDEALAALKHEVAGQADHAWNEATFAAWVISQSPAWKVESQSMERARLVRMSRFAVRLNEWPSVRATLRQWSDVPGIAVTALELEAGGRGPARLFSCVVIELRIPRSQPVGNPQRAGPSPGALPVAAAGADQARKVGASLSLRSSRPAHPGSSVRTVPLPTKPTKQP